MTFKKDVISTRYDSKIILDAKYQKLFQKECNLLSLEIVHRLEKIVKDPQNITEMNKVLQSVDTMIGDAKFLNGEQLESWPTMIIEKSFRYILEIRKQIEQYRSTIDQFENIMIKWHDELKYTNHHEPRKSIANLKA